ncbi:MAG: hypothetical protein LBE78_12865 [Burkholderiaceae bacterium]|jgi:hypothetical protein|nr:hypothetical protein [Burkholderiaceae bacterium]
MSTQTVITHERTTNAVTVIGVPGLAGQPGPPGRLLGPYITGGTGSAFTVYAPELDSMASGTEFMIRPHVDSTFSSATLSVNGGPAKTLRRFEGFQQVVTSQGTAYFLRAGVESAIRFVEKLDSYITLDLSRPLSIDLTNVLWASGLGTSTATYVHQKLLTDSVGFVPIYKSTPYTLAAADNAKGIDTTADVVIPRGQPGVFPPGALVRITNVGAAPITISLDTGATADEIMWHSGGVGLAGTRTLAPWGQAELRRAQTSASATSGLVWVLTGVGLT